MSPIKPLSIVPSNVKNPLYVELLISTFANLQLKLKLLN